MRTNTIVNHKNLAEPWKVTLIDTGLDTMTGGRVRKVKDFLGNEPFMLTYGDGVADINILDLLEFHENHGQTVTMTSVQPEGRFGSIIVKDNLQVSAFHEKPRGDGSWINAGYFVCQPEVFDYIENGDHIIFEREPLETLAKAGKLFTYKHNGFWKPMDTQRDKIQLEDIIEKNKAPWIKW
jgi:glucose-1-phosphate cytidylyltransferase